MEQKRPRSREKNVTGGGKGVHKRGEGLGSGPVGNSSGYSNQGSTEKQSPKRDFSGGGRKNPIILILILLAAGVMGLFPNGTSNPSNNPAPTIEGNSYTENTEQLNTSVDAKARTKRTKILGNGQDIVTIMVYMCGTDLESNHGMATADLQEMMAADLGENVNLLVYTGGCTKWKNSAVSSQTNQIYQIKDGNLISHVKDAGQVSMTDPSTLTEFIKWCQKYFPANRNELIFWDHGGGSVSGYGYDQKYPRSGSMNLAGISQALKNANMTFDFIGFDACLMATAENALMLTKYGDYLIASEETEPGVGWYYTDWLTALGKNPSLSTVELGKQIVDDFVETCAKKCRGQKTTLSVVDLAELEVTLPQRLADFSRKTSELLQKEEYQTVSKARYQTREFAQSSKIDQVDLVHLASNMGTEEGKALADAILGTVKYNRTSSNMTNAYGLSIYFPYQKTSSVDQAVRTYQQIGMDEEYSRCIQEFASLEVGGQVAAGGTASPFPSLLGGQSAGGADSSAAILELLGTFLSGNFSDISGLDASNSGFLSGRGLDTEGTANYLATHRFDSSALQWEVGADGSHRMALEEQQWELVQSLELNVFYDDGEGYLDLGLDNVFSFDEDGALIGDTDGTWLAINEQPVAYYYLNTVEDGENYTITGRVPVMLNGQRADLLLVFDQETPYGYIAGACYDYVEGETETIAKNLTELCVGDRLEFLCDYYSYSGEYEDSYYLGEAMTVEEEMKIHNVEIQEGKESVMRVMYRFTDIYNQSYWTPSFLQ
ncbi:MAG: clostripain-related cysteine peptidase [Lachnospiraceae bacterium]|nr:clostripain-related cysteine peptidase [Lachnospiraceae bacterium]